MQACMQGSGWFMRLARACPTRVPTSPPPGTQDALMKQERALATHTGVVAHSNISSVGAAALGSGLHASRA